MTGFGDGGGGAGEGLGDGEGNGVGRPGTGTGAGAGGRTGTRTGGAAGGVDVTGGGLLGPPAPPGPVAGVSVATGSASRSASNRRLMRSRSSRATLHCSSGLVLTTDVSHRFTASVLKNSGSCRTIAIQQDV